MRGAVMFTREFGGVNQRLRPHVVGPKRAQDMGNVDLAGGTLRNRLASESLGGSVTQQAIYDWNGTIISDPAPYLFAEYSTRLLRGYHVCDDDMAVIQYTTDTSSWHALGVKAPAAACSAADSGGGAGPNGTYTYYVTFYNAYGDESAPSPVSGAVTVVDNTISVSAIPIGYGTGDLTNGTDTIANVTNITYFRVGMQVTSPTAGITASTYITGISGTTITMSEAFSGITTAGATLQDAQVTGRKLYRSGGTVAGVLLVTTIANVTAPTYSDSTADTSLGAAVTTSGTDVLPTLGGFAVSPSGVLVGVKQGSTEGQGERVCFSEVGKPHLWREANFLDLADPGVSCFYGLDRFFIFTIGRVHYLAGSTPADFQLFQADGHAPLVKSQRAAPVEMSDGIWFASQLGVTLCDGTTVRSLTEEVFTRAQNERILLNCRGAARWGNRYAVATTIEGSGDPILLVFDPAVPGGWILHKGLASVAGVAYCPSINRLVVNYNDGANTRNWVFADFYSGAETRNTGGTYTTGEWVGESITALKRFRRLAFTHDGQITVTIYIDGTAVLSSVTLTRTTLGRSSLNLPGEMRGRAVSVKIVLDDVTSEIYEIDVWAGDVKAVMP